MEPEIYVFNSSGCHGHYLRYLIDRCSSITPPIIDLPFNSLGNSHKPIKYSNYVTFVDTYQHVENKNLKNKKIIKIIYSDDILYYERVAMNRAGDSGKDINTLHKDISFLKDYNNQFYKKIKSLYSVDIDSVPKWLLRDAYKLGFLDQARQGSVVAARDEIRWAQNNLSQNNHLEFVHVNVFFGFESLKNKLLELGSKFDLKLDLTPLPEIHDEFLKLNYILKTQNNPKITLDAVEHKLDITVPDLDIIQQAFVYAELEKKYQFVTMPMTDYFFETTKEIIDYCEHFPQHYKAMNPNLPKFNNIDNPFFLHRQNSK